MGSLLVKIKLMPESLDVNLDEVKELSKKVIENVQGKGFKTEEEPIAFGLKALIVFFEILESQELEPIENEMAQLPGVNSAQVIDMRRVFM